MQVDGGASLTALGDGSLSPYYLETDPESTQRLLVGDWATLYFSGDAGQTFQAVHTTPSGGAGLILGGAFWDGQDIFAGTSDGLLVSHDGGQSFALEAHGGFGDGLRVWRP